MSLKSEIGRKAGPYEDQITSDRIAAFCKSIGIKTQGDAPPTFLTLFRRGEFDLFSQLGIDLSKVLHAEQEYEYENPIRAGDQVRFETSLANVLEKQSATSKMQFLTFETTLLANQKSETRKIGKAKSVIVVREQVQG